MNRAIVVRSQLHTLSLYLISTLSPQALKEVKVNGAESDLAKKNREALKHKRSFFVRMVSDPKLYNPKIVKTLPRTDTNGTEPESETAGSLRSPSM